ncbi:GAF domain-containing protein [Chryseolinea sp. H1M3-3]|uniref:GAF domain-containing protein n=1 Tax=Chryseolinea sp. H1M3-3 TaxID=3034144 RepID=UPI0023ED092D|nr:GAF domain-containing protein [Chryseolinea sp. H1M3-3]
MRNRALKFTLAFAIVSLVIITLIIFVQRGAINSYDHSLPYVKLNDHLRSQIAQANLWAEQVKKGDPNLNFERDVQTPLAAGKLLMEAMYEGKVSEFGEFEEVEEEEGRAILKESIYNIQSLLDASQARWGAKPTVITPATDSTAEIVDTKSFDILNLQLDASLKDFQRVSERLVDYIDAEILANATQLSALSWISIFFLMISLAGFGIVQYRLFQKTENLEEEKNVTTQRQEQAANSLSNFMEAISAGNYSADLSQEVNHGAMGTTLITMRDKLKANAEEDRKRNWSTSGLAQIGELLRTSYSTTQDLFDHIIKFVVKYTKSTQGGLFLLNEEETSRKFLELVGCYAYERKKFLAKHIEIGEGLVGQSFLEAETIYLVEVPEDYISISSSLGGASPNALMLVPLKVNGKVFGILELATFGKYDPHEIELVEKLAESIASTISTVRINESTRILLEKTQQQTEEMRAQEEEMRQNMEELEATQEEMRRKEKHIQTMLDNEKRRNEIANKNRQASMELSKKSDIQEGNWDGALEKMTITITKQLTISRCGVWSFNRTEQRLACEKLFDNSSRKFEVEPDWFGKDYPGYFEAITGEEIIKAIDAHTHPATRELSEKYLIKHGIQSVLVVPFFNEGKITGIICCENFEQKEWTEEDVEFLKSCADLVTLTFNNRRIKTMVEKLSDDQETMQTIIDNIPRAVFWKGKDLRFQGCNKIFAQVAGLKSYHDLVGRTDYDMPWKEHGDAYRADDLAVMNSRKARVDMEEKNVNNDGKVSWVLTTKVPIMNKHGEIVAVLGMFEDITERKLREADISSKLQELEDLKRRIEKQNN